MKFIFFLLSFISSTIFSHEYKHNLSICCIFQDDAKYLPEWIEFHIEQGVQHFYLYNNLSTDNQSHILRVYIDKGIVTLVNWPYSYQSQERWNEIQCRAYMHCVKKYRNKTKWIAFLDSDEFLFCPNFEKLTYFLNMHDEFAAINARWVMYGTSNVTVPEGRNLTDYLVYRAPDGHHTTGTMKPIAKTKYIYNIVNPHFVILGFGQTWEANLQVLRINHYWSRDLDFFYNVKLPRRERWYHDRQVHIEMEKEFNAVYDPILAQKRD